MMYFSPRAGFGMVRPIPIVDHCFITLKVTSINLDTSGIIKKCEWM